jgi:3-oxoadipate enol-lactonase
MSGTVVLCGSLGSSTAMWEAQSPALARWDVVAIDHPGHGGAPLSPVASVSDLARHVLDRVEAERFSFVGHSLGGAVGLRLALDEPDRLERLVLSCSLPRFGEPDQWRERAELVRAEGLGAIADGVLARWFTLSFGGVDRFRAMFLGTDPEGYARCCDALAGYDLRTDLGAVQTPALLIAGSEDPTAPPAAVEEAAAARPGSRVEGVEPAAPLAPVERAAEYNRLLEEHL